MTDRELRRSAAKMLTKNTDVVTLAIIYFFSTAVGIFLIETFISVVMRMFNDPEYSFFKQFKGQLGKTDIFLICARLLVYFIVFSLIQNVLLRYFINMTDGGDSDRFISMHWSRLLSPCLRGSLELLLYKLMVASPLAIWIWGIHHFREKGVSEQLSMLDLVCFMLCIGFTIVWFGELVHYFISLSLVKYIFAINPRANFFDACDLSVKLMDGKHSRVISFWLHMVPYIVPGVLVYPLVVIYPFVTEANLLFCRSIMGDYWQDKIPAMARRWERQQARLKGNRR